MAADGGKRSQLSIIPPRKINVQKFAEFRASELDALHSIVAGRLSNDFRSQRKKRRRTTAYDSRSAKKRYRKRSGLGVVDRSNALPLETDQKRLPRRVLRRLELKKNPPSGFSTSGDGTKRLRTHVWHAKRFRMEKLWGFHLPLGLQGRGRGSRALLKWFKNGVLLHDASYYITVQLEGLEDSLISVLRMVLVPSPLAQSEDNNSSVLSGRIYGTSMLHHPGEPTSQSIAPVIYMWQPLHLQNREAVGTKCDSDVCNNTESAESCSSYRQLWVWIHPSAFDEGYDALRLACQKQTSESGLLINCISLEGQLARFEVMGSKAFQILQKTLHPVTCSSKTSWQLKKCSVVGADQETQSKKAFVLKDEGDIPSCSILSLIVKDPRTLPKKSIADGTATIMNNNMTEDEAKKHVTLPDISDKGEALLSSSMSKAKWNDSLHDGKNMWDASSRMCLPVEESILCLEKYHSQMDFVCLDYPKAGMPNTPTELQSSRCCATLLLENRNSKGLLIGWSLILPLSWARVFWISIISKGAHAIGLREKRWVACEVGLPDFPYDFPDCNAYSSFMVAEEANIKQNAEKLPPSVRPFKVPIPSPWNIVHATLDEGLPAMGDAQNCGDEVMADRNSLSNLKCCDCNTKGHSSHVNSLDGIVARTSSALTDFLNEIQGDCLLLFPQFQNKKTGVLEFMMDENKFGDGGSQITSNHKLCYLRVLLHAYKEGVFEEGAVVCAPVLGDILLWTSRSKNIEGGLQIPQSSVRSYFKQQLCGNWELQISQDPVSRGSHRWPVGFVTTGFVRGSKKPVAEAFCEATLLARLRQEQWKSMPEEQRRTEIYVLVRNLRSSAYRLGLATIVLEQEVDDVGFL